MLPVFIFAPCYVQFQHHGMLQIVKCEASALDMTGMLWTAVLHVIIVRVMTDSAG